MTRHVPIRILLRRFFHLWMIIALLLAVAGVIVVVNVLTNADYTFFSWRRQMTAPGFVTKVEETRFTEGETDYTTRMPILANHYEFVANGRTLRGVSYATYKGEGRVTIEYLADDPAISRIEGMRTAPYEFGAVLFGVPFVSIAFAAFYFALRRSLRNIYLLRHGTLTDAPLARTRGELTFYFLANGERIEVQTRDYDVAAYREGVGQRVVYDPDKPTRWLVLRNDEL